VAAALAQEEEEEILGSKAFAGNSRRGLYHYQKAEAFFIPQLLMIPRDCFHQSLFRAYKARRRWTPIVKLRIKCGYRAQIRYRFRLWQHVVR